MKKQIVKKFKTLFLLATIMIMTCSFAICTQAKAFAGGKGTKKNPYKVATFTQLKRVKNYNGRYFKQVKDISCGYKSISSLFSDDAFYGVYDGAGHTIKNLLVRGQANNSFLIPSIDEEGTIKNVVFKNITISGVNQAALMETNNGKLQKITMQNCVVKTLKTEDGDTTGALLCINNAGTISSCKVKTSTLSVNANSWTCRANGAGICIHNIGTIRSTALSGITLKVASIQYEAVGAGLVMNNDGSLISSKIALKKKAVSSGDVKGQYGAVEYGWMARLVYTNKGLVRKCSSTGSFSADQPVKRIMVDA